MTTERFPKELEGQIAASGVIAVLVLDEVDHAVPLARALLDNGITVMELTLRTPAALDGLRRIRDEVPDMLAGAGTILTPGQVSAAVDAGAAFGVAPGLSPNVLEAAEETGLPFAPGIATPSEVEAAIRLKCRILKFFPAEPLGGLKYLKSMAAPYKHLGLRFMPLGGLNFDNMSTYLASDLTLGLGGSWIAPRDVIRQADWRTIGANAAKVRKMVDEAKKG